MNCNGEAYINLVTPLKEAVLQEASRSPDKNTVCIAEDCITSPGSPKGPDLDRNIIVDKSTTNSELPRSRLRLNRLSDCRGHDLLIALDRYRTVGQGIENVQLIVILDHTHEVHTDGVRRKACPSASEVLADVVRRRACPHLLRSTHWRCEEEGRGANPSSSEVPGDEVEGHLENVRKRAVCNPSSSEVPAAVVDEAAGLGGGELVSPPPVGVMKNFTTMGDVNNHLLTKREVKNLSSSSTHCRRV